MTSSSSEDEDFEVDLDLPPEWTDEEIRGIKRFAKLMLDIAHVADYTCILNNLQRAGMNSGFPVDRLGLPKQQRKKRTLATPPQMRRKA